MTNAVIAAPVSQAVAETANLCLDADQLIEIAQAIHANRYKGSALVTEGMEHIRSCSLCAGILADILISYNFAR